MNLMDLFIKIDVDDKASDKIEGTTSKFHSVASSIGKGLATAAKIGTAALSAAATGVVALTKASIDQYAEYEQLVGGVETLFKSSADAVMGYAENAYKTAGLSANQYMTTVTSFSASLLQSLDGDTAKAAEKADMAITDMADNANKMGSDLSTLQTAYAGFAKGQFMLLDNLKIGYGGTKTEMERLLADAESISGVHYDISSYADIVDAIHVVQTEMGITGTTSKEASSTIQGSVGMMKSAWQNLVTGMANSNADLSKLIKQFVDSVGTVVKNIMPKIGEALNGAAQLISEVIPVLVEQIPVLIEENLPILAEAAVRIVQSLIDGISNNTEMLFETIFNVISYIATSFISMLPQIIQLGLDLIISLAQGIANSLPTMIPTIISVIVQIVKTLTDPDTLSQLLKAAIDIIKALAEYLLKPETINTLIDTALEMVRNLAKFLMDNLGPLLDAAIDIIMALVDYLLDPENLMKLVEAGIEIVVTIAGALVGAVGELIKACGELILKIFKKFTETDWGEIGRSILDGIKNGISNAWNTLKDWFSGLFDDLIGIAKKILGIASPSKVFKRIGKFSAEGFGEGFEDEFANVERDIENSLDFSGYSVNVGGTGLTGAGGANGVSVVQNIYSEAKTAADLMEEALYYQERAVLIGV